MELKDIAEKFVTGGHWLRLPREPRLAQFDGVTFLLTIERKVKAVLYRRTGEYRQGMPLRFWEVLCKGTEALVIICEKDTHDVTWALRTELEREMQSYCGSKFGGEEMAFWPRRLMHTVAASEAK